MIICEMCSGRHATSVCVLGKAHIEACFSGTPDDYHPPVRDERAILFAERRALAEVAMRQPADRHRKSATQRSRERRARLRLVS